MWAVARYTFSLSEEEFWEMSPGMWSALHRARLDDLRITDTMNARLCAVTASTAMGKKSKRPKEEHYLLFPKSEKQKATDLRSKFINLASKAGAGIVRKLGG